MNERSERRGRVVIDREFQFRFVLRLAGVLMFYLLLFLIIAVVAPVTFALMGDSAEWAMTETAFRVEVLLRLMLAPLLCTFLCLFAHGVLETFRIAGPNYRFKVVFKDLAAMRIPRGVKIRKDDYLQDTAAALDESLVAFHDFAAELKLRSRETMRLLEQALPDRQSSATVQQTWAAVERIDEMARRFQLLTRAPECKPIEDPIEDRDGPVEAGHPEVVATAGSS